MAAVLIQSLGFGAGGFMFTFLPAKLLVWLLRVKLSKQTENRIGGALFCAFFAFGLFKFSTGT